MYFEVKAGFSVVVGRFASRGLCIFESVVSSCVFERGGGSA